MIRIYRYTTGHFITLDAYLNEKVSRGYKIFLAVCGIGTAYSIFTMIIKHIPDLIK
jgi:hypothetical protein